MRDLQKGEPWLGVNPNYKEINVETQLTDSDSLLSFYKKLTALRKAPEYKETLVYGTFTPYQEERKNLIAYTRNGEKDLLILGNTAGTVSEGISSRRNEEGASE